MGAQCTATESLCGPRRWAPTLGGRAGLLPLHPTWILNVLTLSSAPDPPRHHLRRCAAPWPPTGSVPKEASGACGPEAEPHLPAPGFRLPEGAPHAAHAG